MEWYDRILEPGIRLITVLFITLGSKYHTFLLLGIVDHNHHASRR